MTGHSFDKKLFDPKQTAYMSHSRDVEINKVKVQRSSPYL